ncbi:hypothetical protein HanIR_Chr16g0815171 [Helianthus annuus]|nr:hypothetical protein HanIR_Chr16g0815171 [Helianthus annuus]
MNYILLYLYINHTLVLYVHHYQRSTSPIFQPISFTNHQITHPDSISHLQLRPSPRLMAADIHPHLHRGSPPSLCHH